jgi:hypothetical protein
MRVFGFEIPGATGLFGTPSVNQVQTRQGGIPALPSRMGVSRGWTYDPLTEIAPPDYGTMSASGPSGSLPANAVPQSANTSGEVDAQIAALFGTNPTGENPPEYSFTGPNINAEKSYGEPPVMAVIDPSQGGEPIDGGVPAETNYIGYVGDVFNRVTAEVDRQQGQEGTVTYSASKLQRFTQGFLGIGRAGAFVEKSAKYEGN